MDVILRQDVPDMGKSGTVLKVKDGYARNFLFPRELAYPATPDNLKRIQNLQKKRQAQDELNKKEAQRLADQLSKVSCTVAVEVNDLEKLYGSVTEIDIAKALELEGINVDKKAIILEKPIEELGIFDVTVQPHPEVTTKIRVWVTKK
jgi:large subunit ribosomal protein L9